MNRAAFQRVAVQRRREAAALLRAGLYPGAYYLVGYAVECALKACIARRTERYDFPDRKLARDAWTHDIERLSFLAGIDSYLAADAASDPRLALHWTIVKTWTEAARYDLSVTRAQAEQLYSACAARRSGILPWIRQRW